MRGDTQQLLEFLDLNRPPKWGKLSQSLVVLTSLDGEVSGRRTTELLSSQLRDESNRLERSISLVEQQLKDSKRQLGSHRSALDRERKQLNERVELQDVRVKLARDRLERLEPLRDSNSISQAEYEQQYEDFVEQQQLFMQLESELLESSRTRSQVANQVTELERRVAITTDQLRAEAGRIKQALTETLGRSRVVIRAPIDAEVAVVAVSPGQIVGANQLQIALLPSNSELYAEFFLPTRAAGLVKSGQSMKIHYDAFPYQRYGSGEAKIVVPVHAISNRS